MGQKLTRIHLHWTAGGYTPNSLDLEHYHFVIDGTGAQFAGKKKPEDNLSTVDGVYAAHTLGANTGAIGIAVCAMLGAKEAPFSWGAAPIRPVQLNNLCRLAARLATQYGIKVQRDTILTHAEIEPTLGVKQKGKWDITILPGMAQPGDPIDVGDQIRALVSAYMKGGD